MIGVCVTDKQGIFYVSSVINFLADCSDRIHLVMVRTLLLLASSFSNQPQLVE